MPLLSIDYSTLNLVALRRLPVHKLPVTYHYGTSLGSACAGDPPGYPSYFLQNVYDRWGNTPARGAEAVICYQGVAYVVYRSSDWDGCATWEELCQKREARLRRLWKPLPLEHPRTQAWIGDSRRHHANCYQRLDVPGDWNQRLHVGAWTFTETVNLAKHLGLCAVDAWLDAPAEDETEAWQEYHELAFEVRAASADATILVRRFYPEYKHDEVTEVPAVPTQWWEVLPEQPNPETCPGQVRYGDHKGHPYNGSWCQICGWKSES